MHNSKYYLPDMQKEHFSIRRLCQDESHMGAFELPDRARIRHWHWTERNISSFAEAKQDYIKHKAAAKKGDSLLLSSVETEDSFGFWLL